MRACWRFSTQRALGCQTSLDDFGTGFSSLSYLCDFPFDVLKIDKSFIDHIDASRHYGLVASIVSMARILGMQVVAEGVEEESQVRRLRQIGCEYVQGFYFARPQPFDSFLEFVTPQAMRAVS
ncbi:MAG: EAL domain-containing protein [Pseudomonadales bacterium]